MKTRKDTPSAQGPTGAIGATERIVMRTKLEKPQLPETYVPRTGLIDLFNTLPIVLVSASAGSGKTTAVKAWLNCQFDALSAATASAKVALPYLWYRLDAWDNDLDVFLSHLAYGVDTALEYPSGSGFQDLLAARSAMGDEALLRTMVAKLEHIPGPAIWVFDDYHEVTHPAIHHFVSQLMHNLAKDHKLIIITREDPPLMLAKIRASGRLTSIREVDLRMTLEEAKALLDPRLSTAQVSYLHARTEGWVAGLQLTGQTLRAIEGHESVDGFIEAYRDSNAYIMDYLVEEVLSRQPENLRQFLINTAIFEDFCPELADFTLELSPGESEGILHHLVKINCFVMPLQDGKWFRYHQLFKELLRQRSKGSTHALNQRAGSWFEARGQLQEAIHYYLEGSFLEAARLIEGLWSKMDLEFQSKAWLDLAKRLPHDILWKSPVIAAGWGWSLLNSGEMETSVAWIDRAQWLYDQKLANTNPPAAGDLEIYIFDPVEFEQLPLSLLSARAYISASKGDFLTVMSINESLRASTREIPYQRLWVIDTFVSTIQWSLGNLDAAILAMTTARQTFGKPGQQFPIMVRESLVWVIAAIQIEKGDLETAKFELESAIHRVKDLAIAPILISSYKIYLAEIAAIRGDFKAAFSALKESEAQGLSLDFLDWRQSYEHLLARLYTAQGFFELAKRSIERGISFKQHNPLPITLSFEDLGRLVNAASGQGVAALTKDQKRLLAEIGHGGSSLEALPGYTEEFGWKIYMRYWDPKKHGPTSLIYPLCIAFLERAKAQNRHLHTLDFHLLAARLSPNERSRQNHEAEAGRLSGITDTGGTTSSKGATGAKSAGDHAQIVLPHLLWGNRSWTDADRAKQINTDLVEPLTSRELELLRLIAQGLSNDQISSRLFITLSTVKSYNNSLFAKLGVKRRTEAIYKARDLGLI